jgi:hypothetical protein
VVLDFIIRSARQPRCDQRPPVAEELVEPDDEFLLVVGDVAALDVGPEVVEPVANMASYAICSEFDFGDS